MFNGAWSIRELARELGANPIPERDWRIILSHLDKKSRDAICAAYTSWCNEVHIKADAMRKADAEADSTGGNHAD